MHLGYYWPTMEADSLFARRCQAYQLHRNKIHVPTVELHSLATPWPFHNWVFNLIGPINPSSRGNIRVLAATECYTKWVEAIALKRATGPAVANFVLDSMFCRFGIPKGILCENGTPFINSHVRKLCEQYGFDHVKSTPYYPQGKLSLKPLIRPH